MEGLIPNANDAAPSVLSGEILTTREIIARETERLIAASDSIAVECESSRDTTRVALKYPLGGLDYYLILIRLLLTTVITGLSGSKLDRFL